MAEPIDFNSGKPQRFNKQIDINQVRNKLADNAHSFVQYLFSGRARFSKGEARIGNVYGEKGESLSIHLTGESAGLWFDHQTGKGGNLLDLYLAFRGYTQGHLGHALAEISRDFLGDMSVTYSPMANHPSTREQIEKNKEVHGTKPGKQHEGLGAPVESYLYYDRSEQIVAIVRRYEFEEKDPKTGKPKKTFRVHPRFPEIRPLYRAPLIRSAPHVVLCEGERAAKALADRGIDSTSAMGGASTKVENVDWHVIAGRQVTIWPDRDAAGWRYAQEAARVLTSLGCRVSMVTPPGGPEDGWDAWDLIVAEGGDPTELLQLAKPWTAETEQPQAGRFKLVNIDSLELMRPLDWLIPGKLTKGGLSVLWGPPSCLKSFVAIDMSCPVAAGVPWHGIPVIQGPVCFIAAEGASGLVKRLQLWRRKRAADHAFIPFEILPQNVAIREELDELLAVIGKMPAPPVMIIIDTLARTFGAGDENKQADMNAFVSSLDRLREVTGAHVMVIHHSGVTDGARERGSNVLRGAADTVIKVQRDGQKIKLVNRGPSGKQKDAEEFEDVHLVAVSCAETDPRTGEEIASLLLRIDETEAKSEPAKPKGRAAPLQDRILDLLEKEFPEPYGATGIERELGLKDYTSSIRLACEALARKGLVKRTTNDAEPGRWQFKTRLATVQNMRDETLRDNYPLGSSLDQAEGEG